MAWQSPGRRRGGKSAHVRAMANQRLPCSVSLCPNKRLWTTQYCKGHGKKMMAFGNPCGGRISKKEVKPYRQLIRNLFKANSDHPGLQAADEVMARILAPGQEPWSRARNGPGSARRLLWMELSRLRRAEVSARDALEVALAVWLLAMEQERRLPMQVMIATAIAYHVFRLAKMRTGTSYIDRNGKQHRSIKVPTAGPMRLLGARIMDELAPFMASLQKTIEDAKQTRNDSLVAMRQSLAPPTADATRAKPAAVRRRVDHPVEVEVAAEVEATTTVQSPSPVRRTRKVVPEVPLEFIN